MLLRHRPPPPLFLNWKGKFDQEPGNCLSFLHSGSDPRVFANLLTRGKHGECAYILYTASVESSGEISPLTHVPTGSFPHSFILLLLFCLLSVWLRACLSKCLAACVPSVWLNHRISIQPEGKRGGGALLPSN